MIDHTKLDFTSMMKFIEQNWRLRPLTRLDAKAGSIMGAFDFQAPPRRPDIIPLERSTAAPPVRQVRDVALYGLYGIGVLFALCVMFFAVLRPARRKHRRLIVQRPGGGPG
jgi:phospholipase C